MKPFDLEAAKAGAPIITRRGVGARFIAHAPECSRNYRVIALIEGDDVPTFFSDEGCLYSNDETPCDLFMAPQKRTVYVNLWPGIVSAAGVAPRGAYHFETEQRARDAAKGDSEIPLAVAVPVEIEV